MLVNGKWDAEWQPVQGKDAQGRFIRQTSTFRDWITIDGSQSPEGQTAYKAEANRYHLYVAYICPWACRTLMVRALKKLEDVISISVVSPVLTNKGWKFDDFPGSTVQEPHIGADYMHEIYSHADPMINGRATVPVLWDKKRQTIVNNESSDIIRILNSGFDAFGDKTVNLRPPHLLTEIETLSEQLYNNFNNGVYKAGFATSQLAYDEAVTNVFKTLDTLEEKLSDNRNYILGNILTEVDIRLFVTLIRFDAAYVNVFKCNLKRIADYKKLSAYTKRLFDIPEINNTVFFDHIKAGYYSVKALNPSGIIPQGPELLGFTSQKLVA